MARAIDNRPPTRDTAHAEKVFNTLGRAWVASGRDGWEDLFRRSAEILQELEPTDLPRTWCYLAQGYLRSGRLAQGEEVLSRIDVHPGIGEMSRWFLHILQADLARRHGSTWVDPEMERATITTRVGHPFAFYLQATARQPGRQVDDVLDRFRRARGFLTQDEPDGDPQNIQRYLADCLLLAEAAWMVDPIRWRRAVFAIGSYLNTPAGDGFANHYSGSVPLKDSAPSRMSAEGLLTRVPFSDCRSADKNLRLAAACAIHADSSEATTCFPLTCGVELPPRRWPFTEQTSKLYSSSSASPDHGLMSTVR